MKKLISFMLAAVMLLGLCACGSEDLSYDPNNIDSIRAAAEKGSGLQSRATKRWNGRMARSETDCMSAVLPRKAK